MRLLPGRAGKLESTVATLILFVLIVIAVGVYVRQRDVNMGRFGIVSGQASEQPNVQKTNDSGLSFAGLVTGDFSPVGNSETYDTDNLYEKIDGKAPMYQDAGFVLLTTQRFASGKNPDLGLELYLYDMGDLRNAFSVYSRQKRADGADLPDMPFEYKTTNSVYISHGKYYVEMVGFAESEELIDAMKGIALKLVAQLPTGGEDRIPELEYFPKEGTVSGSWKLQIRDAFGFDGLADTYSAQYKTGEQTVTIFLSRRKNVEDAQAVAKSYRDFLVTNDAKVVTPDSDILKSANASVLDFYGSTEIVFAAGVFVGGIHEADDRQAAQKAAEVLIGRLKEINE
ncbi:MAG: DUF6599 family protein [Planctomycetota bacterium]